jgi:hypothetical protein
MLAFCQTQQKNMFLNAVHAEMLQAGSWSLKGLSHMKAGTNTSTVSLKVVGGDKMQPSAWGHSGPL